MGRDACHYCQEDAQPLDGGYVQSTATPVDPGAQAVALWTCKPCIRLLELPYVGVVTNPDDRRGFSLEKRDGVLVLRHPITHEPLEYIP